LLMVDIFLLKAFENLRMMFNAQLCCWIGTLSRKLNYQTFSPSLAYTGGSNLTVRPWNFLYFCNFVWMFYRKGGSSVISSMLRRMLNRYCLCSPTRNSAMPDLAFAIF
jgi:hypothetical protein